MSVQEGTGDARARLYEAAFHRSPLMKSVADLSTDRYLEVNDTFCELTGFSRAELVGHTAVEAGLVEPAERDRLAQELMALLTAGKKGTLRLRLKTKDGRLLTCRYWGEVLPTPEGPRLFAAAEDITAEVLASEAATRALHDSQARFALAMDVTTDGLWDWDLTTGTNYFSPGYDRLLGLEPGTLTALGQGTRDLVHPDDVATLSEALQACLDGPKDRTEVEYRMRAKDGSWRWILGRFSCVARDPQTGRPRRMLGTHVDLTERRRLEAELAQSDRLRSMGMLAAGVAHEVNNPLAYVMSNLEQLVEALPRLAVQEPLEREDLLDAAQSALEGTQRIRRITRSLGTFARVERSELGPVDANRALESALTMAHNELKYRATVVKDLGLLPPVLASEGKLAQVFLNLLINASHALGDEGPERHRVTVRSWSKGPDVFIEVVDTGHGIAPEHLGRLFEPFFTTKKAGHGTGLGLSISRTLITHFGGDIRVESEVGRGTAVLVRLPAGVATSRSTPAPALPPKLAPPALRGRVLVVEDEPQVRRALERMLSLHHTVVSASHGAEAQALLERDQDFDAIFCDLMMPGMTGMDLHAWLAARDQQLARRVAFVSGGAFTARATDYLSRLDNPRLEKPFEAATLLTVAANLVRAARGA